MDIIFHSAYNLPVGQRTVDGYVDATAMCKVYLAKTGERRQVSEWLSNNRTKQTIKHLSEKTGIPANLMTERVRGVGTWIHPRLAIRFGIWLDDDFGFMVEEWIAGWMTTGQNPIERSQPSQSQLQTPPPTAQPKSLSPAPGWKPEIWDKLPEEDKQHFSESQKQVDARLKRERTDIDRFLDRCWYRRE